MRRFIKRFVPLFLAAIIAVSMIMSVSASAEYTLGYVLSYDEKYVYLTVTPLDSADTLYYTVNGKVPTQKSKVYTGKIKSSAKVTVRIAEFNKSGKQTASLKIKIMPRVLKPVISLYTSNGSKYIKITSATSGAKIYYTTDGSEPTNKSLRYKGKVKYTEGTTVQARAYKSNMTMSPVVSFTAESDEDVVASVSSEVREAFECTNKERIANGSSELLLDAKMCEAADIRAKEIATLYDHTRPNGSRGISVIEDLGISYTARGENIARKQLTGAQAVSNWMDSPSHRATMLSNDFDRIGIGHCYTNGIHYWVQLFIRKG